MNAHGLSIEVNAWQQGASEPTRALDGQNLVLVKGEHGRLGGKLGSRPGKTRSPE
eukprot:CAMPEP_0181243856 /NCGR_PEP_ID=MMETSP1096-20121128/42515_1 /TAXON_ID=156174 ORGANISM="Chrysochromulina ericina, Strain CCMP281" /NCGR_SAMPLE_ID=MMETSP1096 /ASSEMBLY_ACC=CAM_ASM_000453 /LENGTH=54 /DNA_ID=CAMNT_0023340297 /DNA_START=28 /DNA_END=189 /DNA_ORIENTATION=-